MNLVIIGHVDHGKSTFIGHLLWATGSLSRDIIKELKRFSRDIEFAFLLDQFQEEREKAMTIDTTQIFFRTRKNIYTIIDTPGHLEFVKNAVTGVTKADATILIVSVEKDMPTETKRHAYIVNLLGLKDMLVIINKMDLVDYNKEKFLNRQKEISLFLSTLDITPRIFIPISAKYGDNLTRRSKNMRWYKGPSVIDALEDFSTEKENRSLPLRFPVQDIYQYEGRDILVGKIESGYMAIGEEVTILPPGEKDIIKEIIVFGKRKRSAEKGESIGITLASGKTSKRGDIICHKKDQPHVAHSIRSHVLWMSEDVLKKGQRINLRCVTQRVGCTVEGIEKKIDSTTMEEIKGELHELRLNEIGQLLIKTYQPIVVDRFSSINEMGRFVLETDYQVEAGGIVSEVL